MHDVKSRRNFMNQTELIAQEIVEAVIPGCRMVYRADQSNSVSDFFLCYPTGQVVALEVTASVDAAVLEAYAAIGSRRRGGPKVPVELCKKPWRIHPSTNANINLIREKVDHYLAAVESAGIEHFFSSRDRGTHPAIDGIYTDLKVSSGDVLYGLEPGFISIALPIGGGVIGGSLVTEAVELEALKADNRHKLAAAGTPETHLFVFVDLLNSQVWTPLVHFPLPSAGPVLPPEASHVWVVGPAGSEDEYVVWRASNGSGWQNVGVVSVGSQASVNSRAV